MTTRASQCSDVPIALAWTAAAGGMTAGGAVDTWWTLAPAIIVALIGYAGVYAVRWRRSRA